jgi:hypothetical protein
MNEEIAEIPEQINRWVMENLQGSLEQCLRNGGHISATYFSKNKMACIEFFSNSNCYIIR